MDIVLQQRGPREAAMLLDYECGIPQCRILAHQSRIVRNERQRGELRRHLGVVEQSIFHSSSAAGRTEAGGALQPRSKSVPVLAFGDPFDIHRDAHLVHGTHHFIHTACVFEIFRHPAVKIQPPRSEQRRRLR